jgi:predicted metal-dependent HD superfamily phosphohydrolase
MLTRVAAYVQNLFTIHMQPYLYYHNLSHTQEVVKHTAELSAYYKLSAYDHFIIMTSAWFHDTGHLTGPAEDHEVRSVELMTTFLQGSIPDTDLQTISQYILATQMPVHPASLPEMIICDADTWHLGTHDFAQEDAKVWQEVEARKGKTYENKVALSLRFLQAHQFYTSYCIDRLSAGKQENIESLTRKEA